MKSTIVQVDLQSVEGGFRMTTWLNYTDKLKVDAIITMKDYMPEDREWRIVRVYTDQIKTAHDFEWHRKWTNNI